MRDFRSLLVTLATALVGLGVILGLGYGISKLTSHPAATTDPAAEARTFATASAGIPQGSLVYPGATVAHRSAILQYCYDPGPGAKPFWRSTNVTYKLSTTQSWDEVESWYKTQLTTAGWYQDERFADLYRSGGNYFALIRPPVQPPSGAQFSSTLDYYPKYGNCSPGRK